MSGQPPFHVDPALASRLAEIKESVWMKIGSLQTTMNDRDSALEAFERVLRVNPANIYAMTQVGAVLAKKERYSQAVGYLQRAIAAESTHGEAWAVLAHCYVMTEDLPKAYQAYQNALNHLEDPSDPNLWYGIGLLYDRYGSLDNALEAFLAVLRISPNFERAIEVCFCIGIIYKEQRKLDEAMNYFKKVSLAPNPPPPLTRADGWYQIGHVNELKRDINKALEMYKRALQENPGHAKTLQNLGWLEFSHKSNEREAIRLLQLSLKADQSDGQTWYLLGRVFMQIKEFRQAYDAYQQAVYRDGNNATFWCSIGVLYYSMNQYRDAMDAYARAIRLNPSVSEVWFDLGTLYESCGQTNDAIDAYRRAAELAPENDQITSRLGHLQRTQGIVGNRPQQQSQPMSSQTALQPPHPQLPPPQAHIPQSHGMQPQQHVPPPHQDPSGLQRQPEQQAQTSQHMQQPGQSQGQPQRAIGPLQPIALHQPGSHGLQQPMQIMSQQPHPQQNRQGQPQQPLQPLTRHIMHHSLQQTSAPNQHGLQDSMMQNQNLQPPPMQGRHSAPPSHLPQLSVPGQQNQIPGQVAHSESGPRGQLSTGQPATLPQPHHSQTQSQVPQPLAQQRGPTPHSLPHLPSMQSQQENRQDGRPGDGPANSPQGAHMPQQGQYALGSRPLTDSLPQRMGGEEAPQQLEHIPALQHADGASQQQTYSPHPASVGQMTSGPQMAPIAPLAPISAPLGMAEAKQSESQDGQSVIPPVSDQRMSASEPIGNAANAQPSTLNAHSSSSVQMQANVPSGQQAPHRTPEAPKVDQVSATGSDAADKDVAMRESSPSAEKGRNTPSANGGPLPSTEHFASGGAGSRNEDAKLLHSVAMSSQGVHVPSSSPRKAPILNDRPVAISTSGNAVSSSPSVPVLAIPRSAPAPRPMSIGSSSGLGASSLTKFGRAQGTPVGKSAIPSSLPSPLPPLTKGSSSSAQGNASGLMASPGLSNPAVPPLKSAPAPSSGMEALPSPSSLPVLPALSGKGAEASVDDRVKNQVSEGEKKMGSANGSTTTGHEKSSRFVEIPRSVPISSLSGSESKGSPSVREGHLSISGQTGNVSKRECSPGSDVDKTHKRPRVQEPTSHKDDEGKDSGRRRNQENGDVSLSNPDSSPDVRMGDGSSQAEGTREHEKRQGDSESSGGRIGTPLLGDSGRPRSLTPRSGGPPSHPGNTPLPSFRRERMNMAASKSNSFGSGDSRIKSPVTGLSARSPGPLHLRSAPVPLKSQSYSIPKSQRPGNVARTRDSSQTRSGASVESEEKASGSKAPHVQTRRDSGVGDLEHSSPDPKVSEATGTAS